MSDLAIHPVTGFIIVWLFAGAGIAFLFKLAGFKSLNAVGVAYLVALAPAGIVAFILMM